MPVNVGTIDQYVRIVVGLALVAYALQDGLSIQGWHWAGLILAAARAADMNFRASLIASI